MEISPEEIEKFRIQYEEQQKLNIELSKKEKLYRERTLNNNLFFELKWQDEITKVDKDFLFSKVELNGFDDFENNFTVEYLNLDRILNFHCESADNADKTYPKEKLWDTCRNGRIITKLISYIESGASLCPPIIDFTKNEYSDSEIFALYDGNHRIALCRFLKIDEIPFVVRKSNADRIKKI